MYLEKLQKTSIFTAILLTLGGCVTNPSINNSSMPTNTNSSNTSISERINKTQSVLVEETQNSEAGKRIIGELPPIESESPPVIATPILSQAKTENEILPQADEAQKDNPTIIYSEETHPKISMNRLIPDPSVKLIAPPTGLPSTSYSVPSVSEREKYNPQTNKKSTIHVVKSGETLYSISRKYKISVSTLMKINNLNNKSKLKIGQKITIKEEQSSNLKSKQKSKKIKKSKK